MSFMKFRGGNTMIKKINNSLNDYRINSGLIMLKK